MADRSDPIDMLLWCPACGAQHVDAPESLNGWDNPPHKSHLCHVCHTVWRPADVPTNGVDEIKTRGSSDSWDGTLAVDRLRAELSEAKSELDALRDHVDSGQDAIEIERQHSRIQELRAENDRLRESCLMACEEPCGKCGPCDYAASRGGA